MAPGPTTSAVSPGEATAGSQRHWVTQRERLVEGAGILADGRVDLVEVAGRHQHVGREAAVDVRADGAALEAEVAAAGATGGAAVAGVEVRLRGDPFAEVLLGALARLHDAPVTS